MRMRRSGIAGVAILGCALALPAVARPLAGVDNDTADDTQLTPERGRSWTLRAGTELGQDSSRASTASVDYLRAADGDTPSWSPAFGISGLHSDAPSDSGGTVSTAGRAYFKYGTQKIKAGVSFDSTSDEGLRHSPRWTALLDWAGGNGWTANVNVSTRETHFDGFKTSIVTNPRGQLGGSLLANAQCKLRDTGYGASVGYSLESWTFTVAGSGNSYDQVTCGYDVAVPDVLLRLDRATFQQLAGSAFLQGLVARSGGRIGADTRLLQSSFEASVARRWKRVTLTVDYLHTKDEFGAGTQDNYSLTATVPLSDAFAFDVTGGTTVVDSNSSAYAGLYLTVSL